jgi:hypothetical protein
VVNNSVITHDDVSSADTENFDFSQSFDCSKEGLKYVAGFLSHKFRIKYPHLGTKTRDKTDFEQSDSPWITALSRGGLTLPSNDFLKQIFLFEKIFKEIHGTNGLNTQYKVMGTTISHISAKFPDFPFEIIKTYVRTRTFIRIKYLNQRLKKEKEEKKRSRDFKKKKHFMT